MSDNWEKRFERHYERLSDEECWTWRSSLSSAGYGRFRLDGKARIASRIAYEIANGPIPAGMCVLHSCDNRACVNPSHLRVGSHQENMDDRNSKGRASGGSLRGDRHPKSKISREQAELIRKIAGEAAVSQKAIASMFGISQSVVSEIKNGKSW